MIKSFLRLSPEKERKKRKELLRVTYKVRFPIGNVNKASKHGEPNNVPKWGGARFWQTVFSRVFHQEKAKKRNKKRTTSGRARQSPPI